MTIKSHSHRSRKARFGRLTFSLSLAIALEEATNPPPDEVLPGTPEPWHAVAPIRPDTPFVRSCRYLDRIGEALAAMVLVIGGIGLTGFASLMGGA